MKKLRELDLVKPTVQALAMIGTTGASPDPVTAATAELIARNEADFARGDLDAIVGNYAVDAVLVRPGKVYQGHDEIRSLFAEILANFSGLIPQSNTITVSGRLALLTWTAASSGGRVVQGIDSFVVESGQIVAQSYVGGL